MMNILRVAAASLCFSRLPQKGVVRGRQVWQGWGGFQLSSRALNTLRREQTAICRLLERSGVAKAQEVLLLRCFLHTSTTSLADKGSKHGAGNGGDKKAGDVDKKRASDGVKQEAGDKDKKGATDGDKKGASDGDKGTSDWDAMKEKIAMWTKLGLWLGVVNIILALLLWESQDRVEDSTHYTSWQDFTLHMLATGEVKSVVVTPGLSTVVVILQQGAVINGKKVEQDRVYLNVPDASRVEANIRKAEAALGISEAQGVHVEYLSSKTSDFPVFSLLIFMAALAAIMRRGSKTSFQGFDPFRSLTRARFTAIDPLMPGSGKGVKFSDVAGAHEAKQEVLEFVDFLKNPAKYKLLGAKAPKGALLLGPPGCGKTLLAKAVATEGKVPFLANNGSEFMEMIGGLGAARVRDLFKEAKKRAPCIIYIDELDAIGRQRSSGAVGGNSEAEQTLNQLLVEMDGIGSKEGVVILASTNRVDILDKALLRPGRFDRHILLDLPNLTERREILEHHLKVIVLEHPPEHYGRNIARLTLGFSGADLANVVNEAALYAAREAHTKVTGADLEYAVERVIGGVEKRSATVSPEERRVVAYHEAGHALVGWLLEHTDALLKVTIVPRTNHALGFAQYQPQDKKLYTPEEIQERMCMALGGRAAESAVFNRITTGAQNDLEKVTQMAYAQVRHYGFSSAVGLVSFKQSADGGGQRPYSDKLTALMDEEANKIIFGAYQRTEKVIKQNMDKLTLLAEALLVQETLTYEAVEKLWGPPPHGPKIQIDPMEFEVEVKGWGKAGAEAGPEP